MNLENGGDHARQLERDKERTQLRDDFNNEMAGRDVGRIDRFLGDAAPNYSDAAKRRAERDVQLTTLQILMNDDPAYVELFRETEKRLREVQSRLDTALETVLRVRAETEQRLKDAQTQAERQALQERLDELDKLETDIRNGQDEVGGMELQMDDEENPPSKDELESFHQRMDEIEAGIEQRMEPFSEQSLSSEQEVTQSSIVNVEVPKL